MSKNSFTVIDVKTGAYPDLEAIALYEGWAKGLIYCDMEGFAIQEDGSLVLMDECNNSRCCPIGRFEIVWNDDETLLKEQEAVEPKTIPEELKLKMWNALYAVEDRFEKKYIGTKEQDSWFLIYRPWLQEGFNLAIKAIADWEGR